MAGSWAHRSGEQFASAFANGADQTQANMVADLLRVEPVAEQIVCTTEPTAHRCERCGSKRESETKINRDEQLSRRIEDDGRHSTLISRMHDQNAERTTQL